MNECTQYPVPADQRCSKKETELTDFKAPNVPTSATPRALRIATRHSPLAMWQARHVAARLADHHVSTEIVPLASGGDTDLRPIEATRQVGAFTKRIQEAVLAGEADIAVHSLKDLPTETDSRLKLAAIPPRESVRDCLVFPHAPPPADWIQELSHRARVGTGSRRRAAQLRSLRPDLDVLPIRGNVQTRLEKLNAGDYDAIVLADAGLRRLQLDEVPQVPLALEVMLPAPGQGALAVEVRRVDLEAADKVGLLDDPATRAAVTAERIVLASLHGGCLAPIAALGTIEQDRATMVLDARVLAHDGSQQVEASRRIELSEPWVAAATELGRQVSEKLRELGAVELIRESREPA